MFSFYFLYFDSVAFPNDRSGDNILKSRHYVVITHWKSRFCFFGAMSALRMSRTPHSSPMASQLECDNSMESSSIEVQINTTIEDKQHWTTMSHITIYILWNTPSQLKRNVLVSEVVRNLVRNPDTTSGNGEQASSIYLEDVSIPPPRVRLGAATRE